MDNDTFDTLLESVLRRHLTALPAGDSFNHRTPLKDYGLDSVQSVELVFALEDEIGVFLPDEAMTGATFATFESLRAVVRSVRDDQAGSRHGQRNEP